MNLHVRRGLLLIAALFVATFFGIVTASSPRLGIMLASAVLMLFAFVRRGEIAVCVFVALTFFEVLVNYTGVSLSPIKLTGGALILLAGVITASRRETERAWRPSWSAHPVLAGSLISLVMMAAASMAWAASLPDARIAVLHLLLVAAICLSVGVLFTRLGHLRMLAWWTLLAAALAAAIGFVHGATVAGRPTGLFADPNDYAAALVGAVAMGYYACSSARTWITRGVAAAALLTCIGALLATQSRGGILGLLVLGLYLLISARGIERLRLLGAALLISALVGGYLITPSGQLFLSGHLGAQDSSGRADLWHVAVRELKANPLHGVGLGNYPVVSRRFIDAQVTRTDLFFIHPETTHNMFLQIFAELGIPGGLLFLTFLSSCMMLLRRGIRAARTVGNHQAALIGRSFSGALVGMFICNFFLSLQYQELLWVMLGVATPYAAVTRRLQLAAANADDSLDGISGTPEELAA